MGLRDTADQLDACKAQSVRDEATIAELVEAIRRTQEYTLLPAIEGWSWFDALRRHAPAVAEQLREHWETHPRGTEDALADRDRQIAELEHDLARAESALADRLQHDAHTRPTAHTLDRDALRDWFVTLPAPAPDRSPDEVAADWADEVLALVQPVDGILITPEEAQLAIRAARHSAESIRSVLAVDPTRLHPDVAPYAARLDTLADRLDTLADRLTREATR